MKASPLKAYAQEAYLIPVKKLSGDDIENAHRRCLIRIYDERACGTCDFYDERHSETCDSCAAFTTARQMSKIVDIEGRSFLSIPLGARKLLRNWATSIGRDLTVVPNFPDAPPFRRRITFTKTLYDYQEEAVEAIVTKKRGLLKSPPRSGKTVIAAAAICRIGKKTLVLASQIEWLNQFKETFLGSDTIEAFTDARESRVKLCRKLEDFESADVALATFSCFFSKRGKALLEQIRHMFGVMFVDEVHSTPALETSRVVSRINSEYRIGMSGTIERKVADEIRITRMLFGRIIYESDVEKLVPRINLLYPAGKVKVPPKNSGRAGLVFFQSRLEKNEARKQSILRAAIKYAKRGHMVLIPLSRVESILEWTRWINEETETPGYALPFYGGLRKDQRIDFIEKARNYECKILVGNISLLSVGTNIPRASCIFEVGLNSNIPKAKQRVSRILTPYVGKPEPIIVMCLDDLDIIRGCKRKEYFAVMRPYFKAKISREDEKNLLAYFQAGSTRKGYAGTLDVSEGL